MDKFIKKYKEVDHLGEHSVKEYPNGVKVRNLVKPSNEFKDKIKKRHAESLKKNEVKKKEKAREKLIQERMRDIAIRELEKEGKL